MHGSAMQHITKNGMDNSFIPVAPIGEQQAIADYLDTKCTEIDTLISVKQSKIDALKEYKKSIIYEYVTGKKQVSYQ
jgi:type I restriction enzyme S subunit